MIYTVTFNPAVDYVMRLDALHTGETNRSRSEGIQFGGKGINVSCVLRELGVENTALGFIAGFTGLALSEHLTGMGIRSELIPLPEGMTRINVKLKTMGTSMEETEINGAGPAIPPACVDQLMEKLDTLTAGDTLILAGSIPASLPKDIYSRILERLDGKGIRFVVDAEGGLLPAVLPYRPFLIKPNRAELEGILHRPLPTDRDLEDAAAELQKCGARNVLISLGKEGALVLLCSEDARRHLPDGVKSVVTGNPIRSDFVTLDKASARAQLGLDARPLVLSFGGSLGAKRLNNEVLNLMKDYSQQYPNVCIHLATGAKAYAEVKSEFERLIRIYENNLNCDYQNQILHLYHSPSG